MAYSFKPTDASLTAALTRVAFSQIDAALDVIRDHQVEQDETVHAVRRRMKKLRALLKLVKPGLPEQKTLNRTLRDAARRVASVRDAAVRIETLDRLGRTYAAYISENALRPVKAVLLERRAAFQPYAVDVALAEIEAVLHRTRAEIGEASLSGADEDVVREGIARAYKRAVKAMTAASKAHDPEVLHEWRKPVKTHACHIRLLRRCWPEGLGPRAEQLSVVTGELGTHHDLHVLEKLVSEEEVDAELRDAVRGLMLARQDTLRSRALDDGAFLFAEKPDAFAGRCAEYWMLSRTPCTGSSEM